MTDPVNVGFITLYLMIHTQSVLVQLYCSLELFQGLYMLGDLLAAQLNTIKAAIKFKLLTQIRD